MIVYEAESYQIMGACFEVYRIMGRGFLEAIYQECLELEFRTRGISFLPQHEIQVFYEGSPLNAYYRADFVCYDKIIVEIKAISELTDAHRSQLFNYLKATGLRLGILINFGSQTELEWTRVVL